MLQFNTADCSINGIGNNNRHCLDALCYALQGMPAGVGVGVSVTCYEFIHHMA